uniref:Ovule protein n=1 Tax=Steinernema glaseri TaxID=37863 RepID=A0A1I7YIB8_9BILA
MQTQSVKKTTLLHVFKAVGQEAVKMGRRTRISIQYFVTTVSGCPYMRHIFTVLQSIYFSIGHVALMVSLLLHRCDRSACSID